MKMSEREALQRHVSRLLEDARRFKDETDRALSSALLAAFLGAGKRKCRELIAHIIAECDAGPLSPTTLRVDRMRLYGEMLWLERGLEDFFLAWYQSFLNLESEHLDIRPYITLDELGWSSEGVFLTSFIQVLAPSMFSITERVGISLGMSSGSRDKLYIELAEELSRALLARRYKPSHISARGFISNLALSLDAILSPKHRAALGAPDGGLAYVRAFSKLEETSPLRAKAWVLLEEQGRSRASSADIMGLSEAELSALVEQASGELFLLQKNSR